MKEFLKIDPHTHSKGISLCSQVRVEEIVDRKMQAGYDGAFIMNHCQAWYYPAEEHKHYIERVIEEFERGYAYAEQKGFRLFLGLEVTIGKPRYSDWLLYGVTKEFLRSTPCLYQLSQEELFELCQGANVLLVQAHPFRAGQAPGEPQYMHGVEWNCTQGDLETEEQVRAFAKAHDLLLTCGTDYHGYERALLGGIEIPASCKTATEVADYIRKSGKVKLLP